MRDGTCVICLKYSRVGNPLTIRDFIEMASKMAGKEDGALFTQKISKFIFDRCKDVLEAKVERSPQKHVAISKCFKTS